MSASLAEVSGKVFDYVIIGGGTAGLTVAGRIAENPELSVAVLEAGPALLDDPIINIPAQLGRHFGDARYDWGHITVPQKYANGREFSWPSGKVLGGSSAINFFVWNKPPKEDINAWEKLGNMGWNWQNFKESLRKAENFTHPDEESARKYRQLFNREAHGHGGPLQTSFPSLLSGGDVGFQQTLINTGVTIAKDPLNGDPLGTTMAVVTIDPKTHTRSYAVTAYFEPHKDKANYKLLCNAFGFRIITKQSTSEEALVEATGVEFEYDGRPHMVSATKEVIICSGAARSPQVLELSGIGDRRVLAPLGIKTLVDLPGVGSNMQEHIVGNIIFELDPNLGYKTFDAFYDNAFAKAQMKLHAQGDGYHRMCVSAFTFLPFSKLVGQEAAQALINRQRNSIEERAANGLLAPGVKEQWFLQLEEFERGDSGDCEVIYYPQYFGGAPVGQAHKTFITIQYLMNHPFSRGTVHVTSIDPHIQPAIDPHYLEEPLDLEVIKEMVRYIRQLSQTEPFQNTVMKEVVPGPSCTSSEDMKHFIGENIGTAFHTIGTLSMLPREKSGVVDANLRVYGTKNIRVVDLSVVPLQVASHTQSIAYGLGERAADIILGWIPEVPQRD